MNAVLERRRSRPRACSSNFSEKELRAQIGLDIEFWPLAILRELIDYALDACEEAGVSPVIEITTDNDNHRGDRQRTGQPSGNDRAGAGLVGPHVEHEIEVKDRAIVRFLKPFAGCERHIIGDEQLCYRFRRHNAATSLGLFESYGRHWSGANGGVPATGERQ